MHIDIDGILNRFDGWELQATLAGKSFDIAAPSEGTFALLKKILSSDKITAAVRPDLEGAIAPLVADQTIDVKSWAMDELVGVGMAVAINAAKIRAKNSNGIALAVRNSFANDSQSPAASHAATPATAQPAPEAMPAPDAMPAPEAMPAPPVVTQPKTTAELILGLMKLMPNASMATIGAMVEASRVADVAPAGTAGKGAA